MAAKVEILIPAYKRTSALAVTLTGILYQDYKNFEVLVADQNEKYDLSSLNTFKELALVYEFKRSKLRFYKNLPRQGMAQQRQFLLEKAKSDYILFLDADLVLEPFVSGNLLDAITSEKCGFVGQAVIGLTYKNDIRPEEQSIEFWKNKVKPETITPHGKKWQRYKLHNAANVLHLQKKLKINEDKPKLYKVAWIGGCVMFDRQKLIKSGGFKFGKDLPKVHAGEDAAAQFRVMRSFGGCGQLPSGVYHLNLATTIPDRDFDLARIFKYDI